MATAALTLGIVGLITWLIPPLGLPISIVGIILATIALITRKPSRNKAIVGLALCVIGLILNIVVTIVGVAALGTLGIIGAFMEEMYGPMR